MKEDLIQDILQKPVSTITSKWIIERVPLIFGDNLDDYISWKEKLSQLIQVDSKSIVIIGSSSVGYSLNPDKNFKEFDSDSDIDVAVISSHYFDASWHYLRNMGVKIHKLRPKEKNAVDDHRNRLIYWGTIATDKILQILPFGIEWTNAITEMKKTTPTIDRTINFRIYKDFEALRAYQNGCINKLKDTLLKTI
ncbi:MAG: hypothetical protein NVV82_12955 [Sporocytophaga sp.]|jgi:predicted NUDIX family NTP pyrophosphohydrolase|nr:hypothetical protein [Sporocytophaga sp.]